LSPWDPEIWRRAARFAADAHEGQTVPGTELPYLLHVTTVAMEVLGALAVEDGHDGDLALACALLHDAVEDTPVPREQLAAEFGEAVADGVAALSKDGRLPKKERMTDSLRRLQAQPRSVQLVKLADRITNLQPPPAHWSVDKAQAYAAEAELILQALGESSPHLAARMRQQIDAYRAGLKE
jgi:(p)ppGpp synthase/HD superfamily hydrolase